MIPGLNPIARTFNNITPQQAAFINALVATGTPNGVCGARAYAFFASSGGIDSVDRQQSVDVAERRQLVSGDQSDHARRHWTTVHSCQARRCRAARSNAAGDSSSLSGRSTVCSRYFRLRIDTTFNSFRLDHLITPEHQFTFTVWLQPERDQRYSGRVAEPVAWSERFLAHRYSDTERLSAVTTLTSTLSNALGQRSSIQLRPAPRDFQIANGDAVAFNISGTAFIGRELFSPVLRSETRYEFTDNINIVAGNHNFKFGGDIAFIRIPEAIFELNFAGLFNFGGLSATTLNPAFAGAPDFTPVQQYGLGFPANFIQGFRQSDQQHQQQADGVLRAGFVEDSA